MKMFIWERIEEATESWHPEAGLVVVAVSLDAAKFLIANNENLKPNIEIPEPSKVYELVGEHEPSVLIFPDSGCC